jgi:hypothetical protein
MEYWSNGVLGIKLEFTKPLLQIFNFVLKDFSLLLPTATTDCHCPLLLINAAANC